MAEQRPHPRVSLPADSTLLPITGGHLLVSPGHAVFCPIPAEQSKLVASVVDGTARSHVLDDELLVDLERHGFFGEPRPASPDTPSVQLQLTNDCNLACAYCCTGSGQARAREVEFDDLAAVVREAREELGPTTRVALLGGEPLLVPWALDLAELVLDVGLRLTIFTNGLRLNDAHIAERVAALNQAGAEVRVSLSGPTEALCDTVAGAPRFRSVISGLAQLARHGGAAKVDLMLLPQHVEAIASELARLRQFLPSGTTIAFGVAYLGGREQGEHTFGSRADLETALDRITFEAGERIEAPRPEPTTFRREGCDCTLGKHLHIRSDGGLFTCFKMEEQIGHLESTTFAEGLDLCRANIRPASTLEACASCPLSTLCGGGCRSENLLFTGCADTPVCGPWRVRVISELLAEDHVSALHWPVTHLADEAVQRGIEIASPPRICRPSSHIEPKPESP